MCLTGRRGRQTRGTNWGSKTARKQATSTVTRSARPQPLSNPWKKSGLLLPHLTIATSGISLLYQEPLHLADFRTGVHWTGTYCSFHLGFVTHDAAVTAQRASKATLTLMQSQHQPLQHKPSTCNYKRTPLPGQACQAWLMLHLAFDSNCG
jgi:hypothetical protein